MNRVNARNGVSIVVVSLAVMWASAYARAQQGPPQGPDATIDAATRAKVIDGALGHLKAAYVFAETAEKMAEAIRTRAANKEYDSISSARAFAETLTKDLQAVSKDKHLRVLYMAEPMPERRAPTPEERARMLA